MIDFEQLNTIQMYHKLLILIINNSGIHGVRRMPTTKVLHFQYSRSCTFKVQKKTSTILSEVIYVYLYSYFQLNPEKISH